MKTKKYGYSTFRESSEIKFAVVVPIINVEAGTTTWEFVTEIDWLSKTWKAENNKGAHLFKNRKDAQDLVLSMVRSFTAAFVVEVLEGFIPTNNWPVVKKED